MANKGLTTSEGPTFTHGQPGTHEPGTHVFEGKPDDRQSDDVNMRPSRFRPRYRALQPAEVALHDAIKAKAAELEALIEQLSPPIVTVDPASGRTMLAPPNAKGRYLALAMTSLEQSVMWAVKALTL